MRRVRETRLFAAYLCTYVGRRVSNNRNNTEIPGFPFAISISSTRGNPLYGERQNIRTTLYLPFSLATDTWKLSYPPRLITCHGGKCVPYDKRMYVEFILHAHMCPATRCREINIILWFVPAKHEIENTIKSFTPK